MIRRARARCLCSTLLTGVMFVPMRAPWRIRRDWAARWSAAMGPSSSPSSTAVLMVSRASVTCCAQHHPSGPGGVAALFVVVGHRSELTQQLGDRKTRLKLVPCAWRATTGDGSNR